MTPRARAFVRLAATLTAEPWALTRQAVEDISRQGLDAEQVETAIGVISMFNYFTRVADATGIELDYLTPLPAFEPDLRQVTALRPSRSVTSNRAVGRSRRQPRNRQLQSAWESWRAYVLEAEEPISRRERRLLASIAAEEATDWEGVETLNGLKFRTDGDDQLIGFARKLSRQPWQMNAGDLARLRAVGYSDTALLHVISVIAHQNADSRLAVGLSAADGT